MLLHRVKPRNGSRRARTSVDVARMRGVAASRRGHDALAPAPRPTSAPAVAVHRERVANLDNLKVLLVAAIIAGHSILGYHTRLGSWPYQTVREVSLGSVSQAIVAIPLLPAAFFAMGLFFLISGLVTPGSIAHKGPGRFARDRIMRLSVPLAIWALGVWPALLFARDRVGTPVSFWSEVVHRHPFLEPGPMWFVEVLLIYSLGYAAWQQWRTHHAFQYATPSRQGANGSHLVQGRTLVVLAVGISLATLLVRPLFPFDSRQAGMVKLWQWPQYLGMFGFGIVAVQRGWLDRVPERIWRKCRLAVLLALAPLLLAFAAIALAGSSTNSTARGVHWAPAVLAALEGPIAVGACVWLLGAAQRHLNRPPGARARALARAAFAAFVLQGPIIIGFQIALRPLGLPAEIKALAVACAAVAGSFALAWALVSRTPVGRIL